MEHVVAKFPIAFRSQDIPPGSNDSKAGTDPVKDPEAPDTVLYCTVPNEQGIYDVDVLEPDGFVQTLFGRICIGITENYDGGKLYGLRTRMFAEVKANKVSGNHGIPTPPQYSYPSGSFTYALFNGGQIPPIHNIFFLAEFFAANDPSLVFARVPLGHYYRDCMYSPPILRIDMQGYMTFSIAPSFANLIAPQGLLWISSFHPLRRCP